VSCLETTRRHFGGNADDQARNTVNPVQITIYRLGSDHDDHPSRPFAFGKARLRMRTVEQTSIPTTSLLRFAAAQETPAPQSVRDR
jgi:hypothetical protein